MAMPAAAEKLSLGQLSQYFNGLTTAQARFTQYNDDGSITTGNLYIKRPGRMRFEYDPPQKALVLAGSGKVAIFDERSNASTPEQYPLRRTPLNIILKRNVNLSRTDMVVGHGEQGDRTVVVARDPDNPDVGTIDLIFSASPVQLVEWVVTDGAGSKTRVVLNDMTTGQNFPIRLFNLVAEIESRQR
jgi:outer membrane lipoprotein-sorting protein